MSGLAAVLAGRASPGVYAWHAAFDVADVQHTVEHAGWRFALLDGAGTETKDEFLAAAGEALDLPEWYGRNFDALADLLTGLPGGGAEGLVLLWEAWGAFARADERAFRTALTVLGTRAGDARRPPFTVLLRGEGPPVEGLALLD